jgi:uncharacterized OB-fold protein
MSTEASTERKQVPIKGARLRLGESPALVGSRCPSCGEHFYPPRYVCLNCYQEGLEEVELSTRGELSTYTVARMALPGSLVAAPYVIAQVRLPEGVQVATVLADVDPEAVRIGMPLELMVEKASTDSDGNDVMTFKFRPVKEA